MQQEKKRNTFAGSIGFVLAAAGSAVGLGNIWRFPYLAAKDGGGMFLVVYLVLALTFGFTLLATELAIGRKTRTGPLTAYTRLHKKFGFLGIFASIVPLIILPYYCAIGGWVMKYFVAYLTGNGTDTVASGYFSAFTSSYAEPIIYAAIFILLTAVIIYRGVNKGIESSSKVMMPILLVLIFGIAVFSLTLKHTDANGVTRTGLEGFKILVIPNLKGMTLRSFFNVLMDAMGQLFYSISVAMGIMITYGSYVKKEENLNKSINQIELFDTVVAFLAAVMVIPAVYTFMGSEGLQASGPSLMFVSLPKVFEAMGGVGHFVGALFFLMVLFAALTSSISIMEAIVASMMDKFGLSRKKAVIIETIIALIMGIFVCLGYNGLFFDIVLPNGSHAQLLDLMDYVSNSVLMPIVAIGSCILIGWVLKPKTVIEEIESSGCKFGRQKLYVAMIKVIAPVLLTILLLKSLGLLTII
ncbi:MAG: sodium-dependent transporter [Clostridia bacterium]|nr:sodium-dependent transporter [Clostridia bacterium]